MPHGWTAMDKQLLNYTKPVSYFELESIEELFDLELGGFDIY